MTCDGSLLTSSRPGTLACIWNAISYCAIRVWNFWVAQRLILELVECVDRLDRIALHVVRYAARVLNIQNRVADEVEP